MTLIYMSKTFMKLTLYMNVYSSHSFLNAFLIFFESFG
jgi:hypothetical protein